MNPAFAWPDSIVKGSILNLLYLGFHYQIRFRGITPPGTRSVSATSPALHQPKPVF
jgi:hypothetical protein